MTDNERILVILDLDETLIHATDNPQNELWDFEVGHYKVYKRPGLTELLSFLPLHFDIAVWSSASDDYVKAIVDEIFPENYDFKFVWGRSRCTLRFDYLGVSDFGYVDYHQHLIYSKILKKVKRKGLGRLEKMLIIDDSPEKVRLNYGNAIYAAPFIGEQDDQELSKLIMYLYLLRDADNVRNIEKRNWRESLIN